MRLLAPASAALCETPARNCRFLRRRASALVALPATPVDAALLRAMRYVMPAHLFRAARLVSAAGASRSARVRHLDAVLLKKCRARRSAGGTRPRAPVGAAREAEFMAPVRRATARTTRAVVRRGALVPFVGRAHKIHTSPTASRPGSWSSPARTRRGRAAKSEYNLHDPSFQLERRQSLAAFRAAWTTPCADADDAAAAAKPRRRRRRRSLWQGMQGRLKAMVPNAADDYANTHGRPPVVGRPARAESRPTRDRGSPAALPRWISQATQGIVAYASNVVTACMASTRSCGMDVELRDPNVLAAERRPKRRGRRRSSSARARDGTAVRGSRERESQVFLAWNFFVPPSVGRHAVKRIFSSSH